MDIPQEVILFTSSIPHSDPSDRPVTFIGKKTNISKVQYNDVSPFLGSKVSSEVRELPTVIALYNIIVYRHGHLLWIV